MKLREIEVGMVIHCRTQEQARELARISTLPMHFAERYWDTYESNTCYLYENNGWMYCDRSWYVKNGYYVTEFEDLFIDDKPEPTTPTKPVLDNYITCELMTGETLDFGGMCNASEINGPKGDLVVFMYENGKKFLNLAAVPMNNIKWIKYVNSRETINNVMGESDNKELSE